jgi:hypothetical protein
MFTTTLCLSRVAPCVALDHQETGWAEKSLENSCEFMGDYP